MRNAARLLFALVFASVPALAAVKNPDSFIYLTIGDIDSLDPAYSYDTASHATIANVYEFLFAYKPGSLKDLEPRLAAQVPSLANGGISKDGLTYTIPIRRGVKFHAGGTLTAEDVRFTLLRFMLQDRDGGPASLLLEPVLGVTSTRDSKGNLRDGIYEGAAAAVQVKGEAVVVRLKKPFAPFLTILASFGSVVDKEWCAEHGEWDGGEATWKKHNNPAKREDLYLTDHVNGTGPFRLERWDKKTKEIVLVRFDGYWRGPAKLKRVHTKVVDEFNTRKLMLQAGDADTIFSPRLMVGQVENLDGVEIVDGLETLESPTMLQFTFKINPVGNPYIGSGKLDGNGTPPDFFTDLDVRKGFAHVIDYEGYIRDVLRGKGRQASGFIPKGLTGYDPEGAKYSFDLAKAAEHFRKAHGGQVWEKGFQLTMTFTPGSQGAQIIGQMIKKNVETLNPKFKIDLRPLQWSTRLSESQQHKIPLELAGWLADYPDPHNFAFPIIHSAGYISSQSLYNNPEADKLVAQGAATLDPAERDRLYKRLQAIVFEDLPMVPIADGVRYRTQRKWVKGWKFHPVFPDAPYSSYYYDLYKAEP